MKAFFTKIGDFLTDSNGDGDVVRFLGVCTYVCAIIGFFLKYDTNAVMALFGAGNLMAVFAKATDPKILPTLPTVAPAQNLTSEQAK